MSSKVTKFEKLLQMTALKFVAKIGRLPTNTLDVPVISFFQLSSYISIYALCSAASTNGCLLAFVKPES